MRGILKGASQCCFDSLPIKAQRSYMWKGNGQVHGKCQRGTEPGETGFGGDFGACFWFWTLEQGPLLFNEGWNFGGK